MQIYKNFSILWKDFVSLCSIMVKTTNGMKSIGPAIAWLLNRAVKSFGNAASAVVRCFTSVQRGRVVCWAYNFKQYSCNPRYLSEYLLENYPDMEIIWIFRRGVDTSSVDRRIRCVRFRTWEYLKVINSAEFLVTNARTDPWHIYWHKRPEQKYLMLWHGGVALKRIERDAEQMLGFSYIQKAKRDSKVADLMISGCRMQTELLRNSFWYSGEILERGIPRNDIFFDAAHRAQLRERICGQYGIDAGSRIVLYAPTFRRNQSIEPYRIDWQRIVPLLERSLGCGVAVLLRLHPNLINKVDTSELCTHSAVIDMTLYHDMQELLCISDMLITDYSSSMFDFAMLHRPCLLYATDVDQYDRGYYFDFAEMPFPLARNMQELESIVAEFDNELYEQRLDSFFEERVGFVEDGHAAEALAGWMRSKMIE